MFICFKQETIKMLRVNTRLDPVWFLNFLLSPEGTLKVYGNSTTGSGELFAWFSFSVTESEKASNNTTTQNCSLSVLEKCHFMVHVHDIITNRPGLHLGSFVMNEILNLVRIPVAFSAEATISGSLGGRNEITSEKRLRRDRFWKSFGISVDYKNNRITGNLKEIVDMIKPIEDVEVLKWRPVVIERDQRPQGGV